MEGTAREELNGGRDSSVPVDRDAIEAGLADIEDAFDLNLPEDYRETLLENPLSSDGTEPILHASPIRVLEENRRMRESGFRGVEWPNTLLVVGGNQFGDLYFIDLNRKPSPVYAVTHEMEGFDAEQIERFEQSPSFLQWVQELKMGQDWFREVRRQQANKKWWQFWI